MVTSANFLGNYEPQGAVVIWGKKTGSAIAKGDVCDLSSGSWQTAPTTSTSGPYAVCVKAAAAADAKVQLLINGIAYVTADGTIVPFAPVARSGATAGQVISSATLSSGATIGVYLRHENEGDGTTTETNAADGDVIAVKIGGQF